MKKIIWLTEWFPVDFEPYNGDSIERHAQAASLVNDIYIIYVKKDPGLASGEVKKEERRYNENCRAVIWFYPEVKGYGKWPDKLISTYYFFKLHFKAIRDYKKQNGKPAGIQVNISMRNGLIALWYRWFGNIQYVILERWSLFLPEAKPYWKDKGFLFRFFIKKVLCNASKIIVVSKHLGTMLKKDFNIREPSVVPNVINENVFFYNGNKPINPVIRFIHISNLDYAKNIPVMLQGFKGFLEAGYTAELCMYVPGNNILTEQIELLGLQPHVIIKGETNQPALAESIRQSDALVLFSLYETFGIVPLEANACGVPVITSNYPSFTETIENNRNGIIANGIDAASLTAAMVQFVKNKNSFDAKAIAESALEKYSYKHIGKLFDEIYKNSFTA